MIDVKFYALSVCTVGTSSALWFFITFFASVWSNWHNMISFRKLH